MINPVLKLLNYPLPRGIKLYYNFDMAVIRFVEEAPATLHRVAYPAELRTDVNVFNTATKGKPVFVEYERPDLTSKRMPLKDLEARLGEGSGEFVFESWFDFT